MNKYWKSLNFIKNAFVPDLESLSKVELAKPIYVKTKQAIDNLQELIGKATPKKAIITTEVIPIYGDNGAYVDADVIAHYHCPCCGNWLSNEYGVGESEELDLYCNNCGQYVKGIEEDE